MLERSLQAGGRAKRNLMKFSNNKHKVSPWDRTFPSHPSSPRTPTLSVSEDGLLVE